MFKSLEYEVKGGLYPKLIRRLRDQFVILENETEVRLQHALNESLGPIKEIHQKVFKGDYTLFAFSVEEREYAQGLIEGCMGQIHSLKFLIKGTADSLYLSHDRNYKMM